MRNIFFLLIIPFSMAQAGTSLTIVHPRNPSHQKDSYIVNCHKECDLKVSTSTKRKGTAELISFESKIKNLIDIAADRFSEDENFLAHQILYTIEATSNNKKISLTLGYPKKYLGKDYQKYSDLVVKIEEIKREMILQTVEGK